MNKKYLLLIDSIILLGSLISVFLLVGYTQPFVTAPIDGEQSLMFTLDSADYMMLDDNLKFDSADTFFVDESFTLAPGRYYIRTVNGLNDEVRQIDIETEITLQLRELNDGLGVFNIGDSTISVETYQVGSLVNNSLVYGEGK